ncbi:hypothetical protein [Bacillus sp. FJAT-22090]|uniref:hypothetical protein n=1 Tax=Bacillus sp. FJAT-22090 TaxID=1581038 RepID=UPI0011A314B7|nr:hypothetical protein [Bacillus sp. FJAT-22090]
MFAKIFKASFLLILTVTFAISSVVSADAATSKVMWGKTELKIGQIGKVTILKDTLLMKIENDGSLTTLRTLKKGEEYRVYSYKGQQNGLYGLGGSGFVQKSNAIRYETPSKTKLALLQKTTETDDVQVIGIE